MQAHGCFDLWVDNQVLLARISGAWNEEEALLYFKKLKEITKPIIDKPWAMMLNLTNSELNTPGADQIASTIVQWCLNHGIASVAEVYKPSLLKKRQFERLTKKLSSEIERCQFSDETEAFAWLTTQGYPVQLEQLINRPPNV